MASFLKQLAIVSSLLLDTTTFAADQKPLSGDDIHVAVPLPQPAIPPAFDVGADLIPNIYDPLAVVAQDVCPGYIATRIDVRDETSFVARLELLGEACNVYGTDVSSLDLLIEYQAQSRLHVNIRPSHMTAHNESWYVLPDAWIPAPKQEYTTIASSDLAFSWTNTPSFGFNVTRKSNHETLFSTVGNRLIYEDQYIEFVTDMVDDYNLYGLGEVIHGLRHEPGLVRTIYGADAGDPVDRNIYGSHPFYMETRYYEVDEKTGQQTLVSESHHKKHAKHVSSTHGLYYRNAHGMEVLMGSNNVTWRALGGEIDLYFFSGPSQPEVTSQYLHQIGLPAMQQYWTFGYHQSRWGYQNWSMNQDGVNDYAKAGVPLETIWNDIDYMHGYRNFENDPDRFGYEEGQAWLKQLHENGQHYIPIVDAAIYTPNPNNASDIYPIFDEAYDSHSLLLNPDGSLYVGVVWPGFTSFPDWLSNTATSDWWRKSMVDYHEKIPFDGIWIDMNEAASFCVGSCGSKNISLASTALSTLLQGEPMYMPYNHLSEDSEVEDDTKTASAVSDCSPQAASKGASTSSTKSYLRTTPTPGVRNVDHPPYVINHVHGDLAVHAVCPNATHNNGVQQYDVHNIYGHQLLQNTYNAVAAAQPGLRPFVIGRSTFVGSGKYTGHWGGDNYSKYAYMYFSIPQALSFSLFGIPMFGVDTCGFFGDTEEELCARWMQLSAFFPFYRNHNSISSIDQEPFVWESVLEGTMKVMDIRFQLLPYLYTLFHAANTRGETVMRALAWEFPNDPSLASADRQFFLGPAVLVTPVLTKGDTTVDGVFPGLVEGTDVYYDWYNQSAIAVPSAKNVTITAPLTHIPVYLRGGHVLATQEMRMTTRDARKSDWSLIVATGVDGRASGSLYLDDGVSLEPNSTKIVSIKTHVGVHAKNTKHASAIKVDVHIRGGYSGLDLPLANVTILGVAKPPNAKHVEINGKKVHATVEYCHKSKRLVISGLHKALGGKVWAKKWTLTM